MPRWTDEELRELISLWPTHSQIVKRLHRPRWAIRSKAKRLRLDGAQPLNPEYDEHVGVNQPKRRWRQSKITPPKSPLVMSPYSTAVSACPFDGRGHCALPELWRQPTRPPSTMVRQRSQEPPQCTAQKPGWIVPGL